MSILSAVALITILVFIHEFGHFIVAKACGVHVTVFSFGFGKRLIGMEIGGTDYRVSMLPFGGYVKMAGADPFGMGEEDDDILDDPSRAFLRKPVWQRLLVVAAGPAFNLALPLVVFTILLMAGEPQPARWMVFRCRPGAKWLGR
jgi:regulator of sigma E protease